MKRSVFIGEHVWTFFGLPVIALLACIITLVMKLWYESLFCGCIALILCIPLVVWRKLFFAKIEFDENYIKRKYRKEIIYAISWEDLVEVRAVPVNMIYFLDVNFDKDKLLKEYKKNICFALSNKNFKILMQYKDKFKDKITDISSLSKKYQNLLNEKKN